MTAAPPFSLEVFRERAREVADRVRAKNLSFIDGVDLIYSAAVWSGLSDHYGDDAIQALLVEAFMNVPRNAS
jgi:hypothetical protein